MNIPYQVCFIFGHILYILIKFIFGIQKEASDYKKLQKALNPDELRSTMSTSSREQRVENLEKQYQQLESEYRYSEFFLCSQLTRWYYFVTPKNECKPSKLYYNITLCLNIGTRWRDLLRQNEIHKLSFLLPSLFKLLFVSHPVNSINFCASKSSVYIIVLIILLTYLFP